MNVSFFQAVSESAALFVESTRDHWITTDENGMIESLAELARITAAEAGDYAERVRLWGKVKQEFASLVYGGLGREDQERFGLPENSDDVVAGIIEEENEGPLGYVDRQTALTLWNLRDPAKIPTYREARLNHTVVTLTGITKFPEHLLENPVKTALIIGGVALVGIGLTALTGPLIRNLILVVGGAVLTLGSLIVANAQAQSLEAQEAPFYEVVRAKMSMGESYAGLALASRGVSPLRLQEMLSFKQISGPAVSSLHQGARVLVKGERVIDLVEGQLGQWGPARPGASVPFWPGRISRPSGRGNTPRTRPGGVTPRSSLLQWFFAHPLRDHPEGRAISMPWALLLRSTDKEDHRLPLELPAHFPFPVGRSDGGLVDEVPEGVSFTSSRMAELEDKLAELGIRTKYDLIEFVGDPDDTKVTFKTIILSIFAEIETRPLFDGERLAFDTLVKYQGKLYHLSGVMPDGQVRLRATMNQNDLFSAGHYNRVFVEAGRATTEIHITNPTDLPMCLRLSDNRFFDSGNIDPTALEDAPFKVEGGRIVNIIKKAAPAPG